MAAGEEKTTGDGDKKKGGSLRRLKKWIAGRFADVASDTEEVARLQKEIEEKVRRGNRRTDRRL